MGLRRLSSPRWQSQHWPSCLQSSTESDRPRSRSCHLRRLLPRRQLRRRPRLRLPQLSIELASDWVTVSTLEDTPTPWPTSPPPVRREPTPTPRVSECVTYRWTTTQVFRPSALVLTEITAKNNCNRDINPSDLMFEITGWRNGGFVQSVRASPFDRIRRRHSGIISMGLPGSRDWYDEITVEIVE